MKASASFKYSKPLLSVNETSIFPSYLRNLVLFQTFLAIILTEPKIVRRQTFQIVCAFAFAFLEIIYFYDLIHERFKWFKLKNVVRFRNIIQLKKQRRTNWMLLLKNINGCKAFCCWLTIVLFILSLVFKYIDFVNIHSIVSHNSQPVITEFGLKNVSQNRNYDSIHPLHSLIIEIVISMHCCS